MGSNQLYSLTWGEFGTSLVSAVQLLRCHGDLVDVTLAAGGRSFPAHKIVLCAASPFLLNLLKSTPCQHPVVMLAGVTASDLEALLEFVYRGEVSVDPNQLPSLLQAAHCLNIQGLAPGTISGEKPEDINTVPSAHEALTRDVINSFLPIRRRKRTKRRNSSGSGGKWARQDNMSADAENRPLEHQTSSGSSGGGGVTMTSEQDVLNIPDVPRKTEETESHTQTGDESSVKKNSVSDQPATCPLCGATLRQSRNLRRHLELLHFGVGRSTVRVRSRKGSVQQQQQQPQPQPPPPPPPSQQGGQDVSGPHTPRSPVSVPSSLAQPDLHSPPPTVSQATNIHSPSLGLVMPGQQMTHVSTGTHVMGLPPGCQNGQALRIPRHEDIQQQQQQQAAQQDRAGGSGLCEPAPVLGCMLPPMPSPHDPLFRQHHTELLRGAGLYAETRAPPRAPGNPTGMRQEVA
ncbi:transcription activator GAGA-like isoform X2 [Periplaneta americana]|uniref:transcription activator GAGA-like isoform X2 n=1 Tax=Periplaneta americana TaxID=6978 RepID=UPI0037E89AF6